MDAYQQALTKVRQAVDEGTPARLSTTERLCAALVLNRPEWLGDRTIVQALDRLPAQWREFLPDLERQIMVDADEVARGQLRAAR